MWLTMTMMEINTNKLFFIEKIAKPAEPVNGQDERRISCAAVDSPASLLKGNQGGKALKWLHTYFNNWRR